MLYVYGFDMTSLKLVSSYLSNWKQRVKINDKFSSQKIISGVPQEWTESLLFDTFLCDLLIFTNDTDIENCADNNKKILLKNIMARFFEWGSTASRLQSHYEETVYFLTLTPEKFQVLIWSTLEGWKVESTLKLPNRFEPMDPWIGNWAP